MLSEVFERFVEKSPISVMVRASLERVLGADRLDLWYERTAQKQYTRDLLFSSVYDTMNQVVFCVQSSVRAAYQAQQDDVATFLVSVYNKLNNLETHTAAEPVRYSARGFTPLIAHMDGERAPWLEGYRIKIVDGNCLKASEHRIQELCEAQGQALPGKSLVVYEPACPAFRSVHDERPAAFCGRRESARRLTVMDGSLSARVRGPSAPPLAPRPAKDCGLLLHFMEQ